MRSDGLTSKGISPASADAASPPTVAILPVRNETAFRIDTELFTRQIRNMLIRQSGGKVIFVERGRLDAVEAERRAKDEGRVSGQVDRMISGADYFLTGTLLGLHKRAGGRRSDYIYYSFELIDATTSAVVWANDYEVKKVGEAGVLYR